MLYTIYRVTLNYGVWYIYVDENAGIGYRNSAYSAKRAAGKMAGRHLRWRRDPERKNSFVTEVARDVMEG